MSQSSNLSDPLFSGLDQLPTPRASGKVIPRSENKSLYDANELVENAVQRANMIDLEVESASEEGRKDGYEHGRSEAEEELAQRFNALEQQIADFYNSAEGTILDICFGVIRRFLSSHLDQTEVRQIIAKTIADREASQPYTIHVAADAEELMLAAANDFVRRHPDARQPLVQVDARLRSDRAVLMTRFGSVDLDIESQLRALHKSLLGERLARQSNEEGVASIQ